MNYELRDEVGVFCCYCVLKILELAYSHKEKKEQEKEKRTRKLPRAARRSESVRFCYLGAMVWLPVYLYALRFGSELHGYGKIGLELRGYDLRHEVRKTCFCAFWSHINYYLQVCASRHHHPISLVYISILPFWNHDCSSFPALTCQLR